MFDIDIDRRYQELELFVKSPFQQIDEFMKIIDFIDDEETYREADNKLQALLSVNDKLSDYLENHPTISEAYKRFIFISFFDIKKEWAFYMKTLSLKLQAPIIYYGYTLSRLEHMLRNYSWFKSSTKNACVVEMDLVGQRPNQPIVPGSRYSGLEFIGACLTSQRILQICSEREPIQLAGIRIGDNYDFSPTIRYKDGLIYIGSEPESSCRFFKPLVR